MPTLAFITEVNIGKRSELFIIFHSLIDNFDIKFCILLGVVANFETCSFIMQFHEYAKNIIYILYRKYILKILNYANYSFNKLLLYHNSKDLWLISL